MDRKVYQVKVGNEVKQYEEGTTFAKIAKEYQKCLKIKSFRS